MTRTFDELIGECQTRGIILDPAKCAKGKGSYGRKGLIELLDQHHLAKMEKPSWGLKARMEAQSPMLCFAFWHLTEQQKRDVMNQPSWIAEHKWDGCRIWLTYHPDEGFGCFSRNISVEDFLPVDYTEKVLLMKDGIFRRCSDFKGTYKVPFIVDTEILCDTKNLDTTLFSPNRGVTTGTELNAVTALLSINTEASHQLQQTQAPLRFKLFDIPHLGDWITSLPLRLRKEKLSKIVPILEKHLPVSESAYVSVDKQAFYDQVVAEGGEGIVLKNLDEPYLTTDSRPRHVQVKRKVSVGEERGSDIDAFVSGFVPSDPDKGWKDYVGALKLSVHLRNKDGTEVEHWLASVSSMPLELRKELSVMTENGPILHPDAYGKVLVINGQDLSPKAKRFMHATANWIRGFRTDKTQHECLMDEEFLLSQIK